MMNWQNGNEHPQPFFDPELVPFDPFQFDRFGTFPVAERQRRIHAEWFEDDLV